MRLSCNGCRVLRKGCTDACTIRPCLQWIKTPEAQANATVFLAKFYGRAGLLNLLAASPSADLRPAVFRSLLYEACGRAVNPVYGAVGLLWSGTWHMCQAAVEAVLKGAPIVVQHLDPAAQHAQPHHLLTQQHNPNYDIRHVVKHHHAPAAEAASPDPEHESVHIQQSSSSSSSDSSSPPRLHLHKVAKPGRTPFKRTSSSSTTNKKKQPTPPRTAIKKAAAASSPQLPANNEHHQQQQHDAAIPSSTHCHASSDDHHQHDEHQPSEAGSSHVTTVPPSSQSQSQSQSQYDDDDHHHHHQQLGLHLTLGFFPCATATATAPPPPAAPASDDEPGLLRFL